MTIEDSTLVALIVTIGAGLIVAGTAPTASRAGGGGPLLAAWRRRRLMGAGMGVVGGSSLAAFSIGLTGADRAQSAVWLVVAGAIAGALVGVTAGGASQRRLRAGDGESEASTPVALTWSARALGVLAAIASIVSIATDLGSGRLDGLPHLRQAAVLVVEPPIALAGVAVAAWLLFEFRRVNHRADQSREGSMQDLALTSIILGTMGLILAVPPLAPSLAGEYLGSFRVAVDAVAAVATLAVVLRPARRGAGSVTSQAAVS